MTPDSGLLSLPVARWVTRVQVERSKETFWSRGGGTTILILYSEWGVILNNPCGVDRLDERVCEYELVQVSCPVEKAQPLL